MGRKYSLTEYKKEIRNKQKKNLPSNKKKWYYNEVGEENYFPTRKELLKRIIMNTLTFAMSLVAILAISIVGLKTVFFETLNIIANLLNSEEMIWLAYGIVLGVGGSLLFYNLADYKKSPHSLYITALLNIYFFAVFFLALNLIVYFLAILLGIWP